MSGSGEVATTAQLEAEISARRLQLASTVDELLYQVQPKVILRRQVRRAQMAVRDVTHTPDGALRTERVAGALAAVAVVLVGIGLLRRSSG